MALVAVAALVGCGGDSTADKCNKAIETVEHDERFTSGQIRDEIDQIKHSITCARLYGNTPPTDPAPTAD